MAANVLTVVVFIVASYIPAIILSILLTMLGCSSSKN